jgi:hypothetical protein
LRPFKGFKFEGGGFSVYAMKGLQMGVEVQIHAFVNSALDGDKWSVSSFGCVYLRKKSHQYIGR